MKQHGLDVLQEKRLRVIAAVKKYESISHKVFAKLESVYRQARLRKFKEE